MLILTVSEEDDDVFEAIAAGACGYLLKRASAEDIVGGVKATAEGDSLISPRIARKVLVRLRSQTVAQASHARLSEALSEREVEVLRLLGLGKENSEIAAELFISSGTVKNHISNILGKLQIDNRVQAAVYAANSGLLD